MKDKKFLCICGAEINRSYLNDHVKTKKHKEIVRIMQNAYEDLEACHKKVKEVQGDNLGANKEKFIKSILKKPKKKGVGFGDNINFDPKNKVEPHGRNPTF
jgi:hypothetical protein